MSMDYSEAESVLILSIDLLKKKEACSSSASNLWSDLFGPLPAVSGLTYSWKETH